MLLGSGAQGILGTFVLAVARSSLVLEQRYREYDGFAKAVGSSILWSSLEPFPTNEARSGAPDVLKF